MRPMCVLLHCLWVVLFRRRQSTQSHRARVSFTFWHTIDLRWSVAFHVCVCRTTIRAARWRDSWLLYNNATYVRILSHCSTILSYMYLYLCICVVKVNLFFASFTNSHKKQQHFRLSRYSFLSSGRANAQKHGHFVGAWAHSNDQCDRSYYICYY